MDVERTEPTYREAATATLQLLAETYPLLGFVICVAEPPTDDDDEAKMLSVAVVGLDPWAAGTLLEAAASECFARVEYVIQRATD